MRMLPMNMKHELSSRLFLGGITGGITDSVGSLWKSAIFLPFQHKRNLHHQENELRVSTYTVERDNVYLCISPRYIYVHQLHTKDLINLNLRAILTGTK
jgi:hypothetical protein